MGTGGDHDVYLMGDGSFIFDTVYHTRLFAPPFIHSELILQTRCVVYDIIYLVCPDSALVVSWLYSDERDW